MDTHKRICVLLIAAILIAGIVGCDGTPSGIGIRDWYELDAIRDNLSDKYFLMNDLSSTTAGYTELASSTANGGKGWEPIGASVEPFTGILDGWGHEIKDVFINRPDEDCVGLFGYVDGGGTVRDTGVTQVVVTGYHYVGGLVGYNEGSVTDSYSIGSLIGETHVGGLVGYDSGNTVSNSYYNHDESLINGENMITMGALYDDDFEEWLANSRFLDVSERLSQEDGYYLIQSVGDFKELLAFGLDGTLKFRLTNDLDLGDEPNFYIPCLNGEFDGNGHKILNVNLNLGFVSQLGLFAWLGHTAKVTGLGVENVNILGYERVGGLAGDNRGAVDNCYLSGTVNGSNWSAGGLIGHSAGTVSNSYFTGSITGNAGVGGLVGVNYGIVSNSYSACDVSGIETVGGLIGYAHYSAVSDSYFVGSVTGDRDIGGLVGSNWNGIVTDSYSTGSVTGNDTVGGLVGTNMDTVENSYSTGSVTGDSNVGGLVGANADTVSNSYSAGSVTGDWSVGGLVGINLGTVEGSYSTGNVTGGSWVGGLVGRNNEQESNISNSYSTGSVIGDDSVAGLVGYIHKSTVSNSYSIGSVSGYSSVGGLVGYIYQGTVTSSFWDTETSGQATSNGGTGKTTEEMQDINTFPDAMWDIVGVANNNTRNTTYLWNMVNDETYPFLSWEPVS